MTNPHCELLASCHNTKGLWTASLPHEVFRSPWDVRWVERFLSRDRGFLRTLNEVKDLVGVRQIPRCARNDRVRSGFLVILNEVKDLADAESSRRFDRDDRVRCL